MLDIIIKNLNKMKLIIHTNKLIQAEEMIINNLFNKF